MKVRLTLGVDEPNIDDSAASEFRESLAGATAFQLKLSDGSIIVFGEHVMKIAIFRFVK